MFVLDITRKHIENGQPESYTSCVHSLAMKDGVRDYATGELLEVDRRSVGTSAQEARFTIVDGDRFYYEIPKALHDSIEKFDNRDGWSGDEVRTIYIGTVGELNKAKIPAASRGVITEVKPASSVQRTRKAQRDFRNANKFVGPACGGVMDQHLMGVPVGLGRGAKDSEEASPDELMRRKVTGIKKLISKRVGAQRMPVRKAQLAWESQVNDYAVEVGYEGDPVFDFGLWAGRVNR